MGKPTVHITKNGIKKKFWGGKAGRKCPPKAPFPEASCLTCKTPFVPKRKWGKYCGVLCRDKEKVKIAISKCPRIERKSSKGAPFGSATCPTCKKPFLLTRPTKKYCTFRCFRVRLQRNWVSKNRKNGFCYSCKNLPVAGTESYCKKHWLAQAAWRAGLRGANQWEVISDLLESQGGRCPYTGRVLVIGVNASIDHKKPRSLFPELVGDIKNLEWIDLEVNRAKRAMEKRDFIAVCKLIAERHKD